ncbi:MAG TPA: undecaprenyl-diphosphate phosphatase [Opitutales bacterium]|nr:undecaprenyl-diphosphate phosphatase [Opitutales bacterium]
MNFARHWLGVSVLCGALGGASFAADAPPSISSTPVAPVVSARTVTYPDAVILGLVEGATEYLPVSSTGHLIVTSQALGLDSTEPLPGRDGQPIITTHHGVTKALSLKDAVDNYNIIIQGGAILAVLLLYWPRILSLIRGAVGRDPPGLRILRNLLIAFIPSAAVGLLIEHWIDEHLFSAKVVAAAFIAGGVAMLAVERWRKTSRAGTSASPGPEIYELSWQQSLFIGACQCFSLWPGMSRSMTTISAGYLTGLRPARAAEFSFLLGLITLTAASGYKAVGHYAELRAALPMGPMLVGIVVATVAAFISVKWFVGWLTRHGLSAFAWYRFAAAIVVLWKMH